jgi:hypothetical protein
MKETKSCSNRFNASMVYPMGKWIRSGRYFVSQVTSVRGTWR